MVEINLEDRLQFIMDEFQFQEHEEEFLFTSNSKYCWFKTSRTGFDILSQLNGQNSVSDVIKIIADEYKISEEVIKDDVIAFTSDLVEEKIIGTANDLSKWKKDEQIKTAYIDITNACNMDCSYCSKSICSNDEKASLCHFCDFKVIVEKLQTESEELKMLYISGGEPLLHPDLVEMVGYASQKGLHVYLWTNGTLLTQDLLERLKPVCDTVIVSIEASNESLNDKIAGKGNFEIRMESIRLLKEMDIPFLMVATPHRENIHDLPNMYSLAYNLGARGFFINEPILLKQDGSDLSAYFEKDESVLLKINEEINKQAILVNSWKNNQLKKNSSKNLSMSYFNDTKRCLNNPIRLDKKKSCGACVNEISIDVKGNVYPCHNLEVGKYKMGKLDDFFNKK